MFAIVCIALVVLACSSAGSSQDADLSTKLSRQFTQSATTALVDIHKTKENIATVAGKNLPSGYYDRNLAAQAYEHVRVAHLSATTAGDQQAATLLNSYFMKVKAWAEKHKTARQSMNATNTMGEHAMSEDSDWQAIDSCEKGMNAMLVSGVYRSIPSCQ